MARIRSIKPGFFTSEDVSVLPLRARLTWIGLWTHCDDQGRAKDNTKLIKAAIWPLDAVSLADIEEDLATLADHGRIVRYQVDGKRYLATTNFGDHQKPNKPTPSRLPAPPATNGWQPPTDEYDPPPEPLPEDYGSAPGPLPDGTRNGHVGLPLGGEGNRRGVGGDQSAGVREAVRHLVGEYRLTDQEALQVWAEAERRAADPIDHPVPYLRAMAERGDLADIVSTIQLAHREPETVQAIGPPASATGCAQHPAGAVDPLPIGDSVCLLCNIRRRRSTRARRPA